MCAPNWPQRYQMRHSGRRGPGAPSSPHWYQVRRTGRSAPRAPPARALRALSPSPSSELWRSAGLCRLAGRRHGLNRRQQRICRRQRHLMPHVHVAALHSVDTCQHVFQWHRWNCSSVQFAPRFGRDLMAGTRERAVVRALSSAALVRSVARACSAGTVSGCGCGPLPPITALPPAPVGAATVPGSDPDAEDGPFKWGGCSDHVPFGLRTAQRFTRGVRQKKAEPQLPADLLSVRVDRHNDRAGRKAVHQSLERRCRCHGVSGSCSARTCWRALPPLHEVAMRLKVRYGRAAQVTLRSRRGRRRLVTVHAARGRLKMTDLAYSDQSPDYCHRDERFGSLGTEDRLCNATYGSPGDCRVLCCGRPYRTTAVLHVERCQCRFVWCCRAECKTCRSWRDQSRCT
ncbi:protein Wnt-11-like [Amphibalanus amphitrite]|uniref:protein Wnt-11-like n=1 Tax=Amphibalanus amphitrite TaxID=1232801 RepID=UPI001C919CE6|nr:protein Wnt-11-like [Amphibalanus amphitrite]